MFTDAAIRDVFIGDDITVVLSCFPYNGKRPDFSKLSQGEKQLAMAILLQDDAEIKRLIPEAGY